MDTAMQDPLVGQLLDERYLIESRLAHGGMATVYLGIDTRLDRTVAVKVMRPQFAAEPEFVSRFIREAKAAARLSHPNVVAVFDQGSQQTPLGESVFLIMEYVDGWTLRDLLRERRRLTPREALEILEPVLSALGAAHQAGFVHRDVKPENVLLAADGRVKVADFGLARATTGGSNGATRGMLMGTMSYLSPEQVERGVADPRSDVYSAGVVLFELLTGSPPFSGETPLSVAFRHVHEDVPSASTLVPGLPDVLDDLVLRATSRHPAGRPPDASAFLADVVATRRQMTPEQLDFVAATPPPEGEPTVLLPRPVGMESPPVPVVRQAEPTVAVGRPEPTMAIGRAEPTMAIGRAEPTVAVVHPDAEALVAPPVGKRGARRAAGRGRRRWRWVVVPLLIAGLVAGVAGWFVLAGPGSYVAAPSLLKLSEAQARTRASAAGLHIKVADPVFSEDIASGLVAGTDPSPNGDVRRNGTIAVHLSKGPERFPIPKLAGLDRDAAVKALDRASLAVGKETTRYDENVAKGKVISSDPAAGVQLRKATPVALVISKGRQPIPVQDYSGQPADQAISAMEGAGLDVAVAKRHDDTIAKDVVISQDPAGGTRYRGDTVNLVVSLGPPLVDVPRVVDKRVSEARAILQRAGFKVSTRGTNILGRVLSQNPSKGTAPKGSTIRLTTI